MTKLSSEQRSVVSAPASAHLLVEAGPGTGKTQVCAERLANLINEGLQPAQILVLSFSRSAVRTLGRRVRSLSPDQPGLLEDLRHLSIRTFDSWAFRVLRQSGGAAPDLLKCSHQQNIERVARRIHENDSELVSAVRRIQHVLVDEFQDLPGVRGQMVLELLTRLNDGTREAVGFTVLGDPAQAIHDWSSRQDGGPGNAEAWQLLRSRFKTTLREISLTRNYRAKPQLAQLTESLRETLRRPRLSAVKRLAAITESVDGLGCWEPGAKVENSWLDELGQAPSAILTRTNGEALRVISMLLGKSDLAPNIPVQARIAGAVPPPPAWVACLLNRCRTETVTKDQFRRIHQLVEKELEPDVRDALRLPVLDAAWTRLLRASGESEGAGSLSLESLRSRLDWPDSFPDDQMEREGAVMVTTIHQAKGMEFDRVFLLQQRPRDEEQKQPDPGEEANVGFVAISRAAKDLRRISSDRTWRPLYDHDYEDGHSRLFSWGKMNNVEVGHAGDLDAEGFVSTQLHSGPAGVEGFQLMLTTNAARLRGRKVILVQEEGAERARDIRYRVSLTEDGKPSTALTRTSVQFTRDLLGIIWKRCAVPKQIYNLRIAEVVSVCIREEASVDVPERWRSSRMWIGLTLCGTGNFMNLRTGGRS